MTIVSNAQKPATILGIAKEAKSIEYYEQQSELWETEVKANPGNAFGWQQLYRARRAYLQKQDYGRWISDSQTVLAELQPTIDEAAKHIPNTFDYYLLQGMNTIGPKAGEYFMKAYEIDPDRSEVLGWLLTEAIEAGDVDMLKEISGKILHHNIYGNATLQYNRNALHGVPKDAVIFTLGDLDTSPKWAIQYGTNFRQDVTVVNYRKYATQQAYRNKLMTEWNISFDRSTFDGTDPDVAFHLLFETAKKLQRPVYFSTGLPRSLFHKFGIEEDIYIAGNLVRFAPQGFDAEAATAKNFLEDYSLEYLINNFQYHQNNTVVKQQLHIGYLPGLFLLKRSFEKNNNSENVAWCEHYIQLIADSSGRKEEVLGWFNK